MEVPRGLQTSIDPAFRAAAVHFAHGCSLEAAAREGGGDLDALNVYRSEHPDIWERFVRVERRRCFGWPAPKRCSCSAN